MMNNEPARIECRLIMVSGQSLLVSVEATWKLWQLRGQVAREHEIPEYEQQFFKDDERLQSNQALSELLLSVEEQCIRISLIRHAMPAFLPKPRAGTLWEAFLALSGDNGDTVSTDMAHQVMLSAGFFEKARILEDSLHFHTSLDVVMTFTDIVSFLSRRYRPEPLAVSLDVAIRELSLLDPRDTGLIPASVFFRAINRLRKPGFETMDDSDSDSEIYEGDDSEDSEDDEDDGAQEEVVAQEYAMVQWKRSLREIYAMNEDCDH